MHEEEPDSYRRGEYPVDANIFKKHAHVEDSAKILIARM